MTSRVINQVLCPVSWFVRILLASMGLLFSLGLGCSGDISVAIPGCEE